MQPSTERIDDESQKFLLDVKKGKPRKFVIIKDGVQIDKLYVFKKGSFDHYVRKARQAGVRGDAFWGVIRGDGIDIHFELSRADGFASAPGPNIRLKEFLKETTHFKFEPDYFIVDAPSPADELDDDELDGQPPEDAGVKFTQLLKQLLPHVKRALSLDSTVKEELQSQVREAQDLGRRRDFDSALATLRVIAALAKQALAEAEADPFLRAEAIRSRQWTERLAQLEPRYSELVRRAAPQVRTMRIIMEYAKEQAASRKFVKALVGLDRLEPLLGEAG